MNRPDQFENRIIRASAGTGKTFQLSNRFLKLLASGVDSATILATTFTRKGAGEILDRIVQRLSAAALSEKAVDQLSSELAIPLDRNQVSQMLRELMRGIHRLQIGTLDAFFYRMAQTFRLELGLPTQWEIVSEQRTNQQHLQAIREILRRESVRNIVHLITGGDAGRRIADLIRGTVKELYDVYLDSEKNAQAWNRLPSVEKFNRHPDFSEVCETLQSLKYPHKSQLNKVKDDVKLIQGELWLELAGNSKLFTNIANGNFVYYRKPLPDECVRAYQVIIEHCRNYLIDSLTRKNTSTFAMLDEFGNELEVEKRQSGELRFDDVNRQLIGLIGQLDESELDADGTQPTSRFSFRLDHQIEHLLLDEFQDTSIDQWNVIKPFAINTIKTNNKKSFFCVGDMKQAIYGWRGGVAEVFDLVQSQLSNLSEAEQLTRSYRSSQAVIDLVNDVFTNLQNFKSNDEVVNRAVAEWGTRFERHSTAKDIPGYCSVEYAPEGADGDKSDFARKNEMLLATVDRIRRLHEQMPDKSIGVLVRANDLVAKLIYMLREAGVNASEEGGNPLTDSASVLTVLAAFTLADHPGDSVARFHLAGSPLANTLELKPETLEEKSDNQARANLVSQELRQEISVHGYGATAERLARMITPHCTDRELWRLQQLVQEAYHYDRQTRSAGVRLRPQRFVDFINEEFRASDASAAQIRVMTIHQSKGLEFDIVVLPIWESRNGWFVGSDPVIVGRPSPIESVDLVCRMSNRNLRALLPPEFQQAYDTNRSREVYDNMCVLYVALTRAVHATHVVLPFNAKKEYSSSGAILLSTLRPELSDKDRQPGILYEIGDEDWYKKSAGRDPTTKTASVEDHFYVPLDAKASPARLATEIRSGRGIRRISPSGLEGEEKFKISSIFSTSNNVKSLRRGTLLHGCFEQITWLDESQPERDQIHHALRKCGVTASEFENVYEEFQQLLSRSNVKALLNRQQYLQTCCQELTATTTTIFEAIRVEVSNERDFAINLDDELMLGTIDRLVIIFEGDRIIAADVIDYKTDHVDDDTIRQKSEHYASQLVAYRRAAGQLFDLAAENIGCKLVFARSDRVVSVGTTNEIKEIQLANDSKLYRKPHQPRNKNYQMKFWKD